MNHSGWIVFSLALLLCEPVNADQEGEIVGPYPDFLLRWDFEAETVVTKLGFFPMREEGQLTGCGLQFSMYSRDWLYRDNQVVLAYGSLNYFASPDRAPVLALKLIVVDFENRAGMLWVIPAQVNFAYVEIGELNLAKSTRIVAPEADNSTSAIAIDDELLILESLVPATKINIWFNRTQGGADVRTEIQFKDYPVEQRDFLACLGEIVEFSIRPMLEPSGD